MPAEAGAGGVEKSMTTFKNYSELTPEQITYMAEVDCGIPALYESDFIVNEKMIQGRTKYYEDIAVNGFLKMAYDGEKLVAFHSLKLVVEQDRRFAHIGPFGFTVSISGRESGRGSN